MPTSQSIYADKLKPKITPLINFQHPDDNQSVLFTPIKNYKIRDNLVALMGRVGGASNIIAISKISKNRILFFLKNAELVNNFINEYGGFKIEQDFIQCRKLRAPIKKITVSYQTYRQLYQTIYSRNI